jgi:hypothetical protein
MSTAKSYLKTLEEIETTGIPGLVEVLREEGLDAVRYIPRHAPAGTTTTALQLGEIGPLKNRSG